MNGDGANLLVTLSDTNYLNQAKQLLSSAYWNAGWKGDYMLLAWKIPDADLDWFGKRGIIVKRVEPPADATDGNKTAGYAGVVTAKLDLFATEFKQWKTIVFIDADCIIRYPLDRLLATKGFTAARDALGTAVLAGQIKQPNGMGETELDKLFEPYSLTATAFNTGVFAFNTQIIDEDTAPRLQRIVRQYQNLGRFGEQLWMNLHFYQRWEQLPMEYNLFASYLHWQHGLPAQQIDGVVLHFPRFGNQPGYRCWEEACPFHAEWSRNRVRAEEMNLRQVPEPVRQWPGAKVSFFWRWRCRIALRRDYARFFRNKLALRSRWRRLRHAPLV